MKTKTKNNLIKGGIAGALGAALAGGTAYLLSSKKARQKLSKVLGAVEELGEKELNKVLKTVKTAKKESSLKVKKVLKEVGKKKKQI